MKELYNLTDEERAKLEGFVDTNPIDEISAQREQDFAMLGKDPSERSMEESAQYDTMDPMMRGLLEGGPMAGTVGTAKAGAAAFPKLAKMFQTSGGQGVQHVMAKGAGEALGMVPKSEFGRLVAPTKELSKHFGKVKVK